MGKTMQVLKVDVLGVSYVCTFTPGRTNAYQLYRTWWDQGQHRRRVAEYCSFEGVLHHLLQQQHHEFQQDTFRPMPD